MIRSTAYRQNTKKKEKKGVEEFPAFFFMFFVLHYVDRKHREKKIYVCVYVTRMLIATWSVLCARVENKP